MRRGVVVAIGCLCLMAACSEPPTLYGPSGHVEETIRLGETIHVGLQPIRARGGEGSLHLQRAGFKGLPECVTPSEIQALNPLDNAGSRVTVVRGPLTLKVRPVSDVELEADGSESWQLVASFKGIRPGSCSPGRLYVEYAVGPDGTITQKEFTVNVTLRVTA